MFQNVSMDDLNDSHITNQNETHTNVAIPAGIDHRLLDSDNVNNTINIRIYTYEDTPLPTKKDVMAILREPRRALPNYFQRKHLSDPKTRNIRWVDGDKLSIYDMDRSAGVRKWKTTDKKPLLKRIVGRLIEDLTNDFESPKDDNWKRWRAYCSGEGLTWRDPEEMPAFQEAERQIECQLHAAEIDSMKV